MKKIKLLTLFVSLMMSSLSYAGADYDENNTVNVIVLNVNNPLDADKCREAILQRYNIAETSWPSWKYKHYDVRYHTMDINPYYSRNFERLPFTKKSYNNIPFYSLDGKIMNNIALEAVGFSPLNDSCIKEVNYLTVRF